MQRANPGEHDTKVLTMCLGAMGIVHSGKRTKEAMVAAIQKWMTSQGIQTWTVAYNKRSQDWAASHQKAALGLPLDEAVGAAPCGAAADAAAASAVL